MWFVIFIRILNATSGEVTLVDTLQHKKTAVLTFQALVKDINGNKEQKDTGIDKLQGFCVAVFVK